MLLIRVRYAALLAGAALAGLFTDFAAAQHSDLEISIDAGAVVVEPRLVETEFGEGLAPPYRLNEPGFEADDGALAPGDVVSIMLPALSIGGQSRNLWFWDGVGAPMFGPSPHELKVTNPGAATSIQVSGIEPSGVFGLAIVGAGGGIHQDLTFDLVDEAGVGVADPAEGVYLWATTVKIAGYTDSPPIFWLAGAGVDEAVIEAAVDYAAVTFGVIPEPSSLALVVVGVVLLGGWRLRRRAKLSGA